ncbi:hydroxyethylthiazole kinase [Legionella worsleiensis]|uniref:Hydroxyethylthiazole kinase n=1 Tax=Legionella worsleiensis TaxID=45076 RepID=A0A0W1A3Q9_9GAMM|nr:hydroxyethylthiazole kinase [Legionella worsleiensis]KTD75946.1 hydroxyethylthiazole kinase [Legionella worsleiensis]STY32959.1 hydroxyethylthiazole kinase [Legionella worsleiensis]
MLDAIKTSFLRIREKKPLVLCLTNYVTMDFMANSLLALGAAPLMTEDPSELEELITLSQAVYINTGTLHHQFTENALYAASISQKLKKPVLLDPVGAGASSVRTSAALSILPYATIVRGNASEIMSLSGMSGLTRGVDTSHSVHNALGSALSLAQQHNTIVVISGSDDVITDGDQQQIIPFGSNLMPLITGMGCTMTAVISAFVAVNSHYIKACSQAAAYFSLCGQLTHQQTQLPGTFKQRFIDNLYMPDWNFFADAINHSRIHI